MSRKLLNLCMTALFSVVCTAAWALSEVGGVYQIGTADDLIAFAELVNAGNPSLNAVLTADIDKGTDGTMIGKDGIDYQGTFDGQGHTVTINMFSGDDNGTALFRNVGARALIQNLKVQGTITTDKKYAAGIAAWSRGTVRSCYIDVNVVSAMAGDATHGGVFGVAYQGAMVENTLAKFTINGATTQNSGGIVGWCDGRTNVINCLVINDGSSFDINGNSGTIGRNDGNLQTVNLGNYIGNEYDKRPGGASTNNYATNAWGNTKCVTIVSYNDLADGRICYQLNNDQSHIAWKQTIGTDPFPVPAVFGGGQVYASAATDCDGKSESALTFANTGSVQATAHQYDKFGICQICGCYNIYGLQRDDTDGTFLISTAEDIDLCEGLNRLQNGGWFSIKMADDITYVAEPGRYIFNTGNWFDGNFNGDGHELTIEMSDMGNEASLFPNLSGTFENVIMHGTIETSGQYAGSITSHTRRGSVQVKNVFSDIEINTTHLGDNTTGGIFGIVETKTEVENTIYAGDINGLTEQCECVAGFAGWSSGQAYYTNCAFLGNLNNAIGDSKTFSRNPENITLTNVYFANEYGYEDEEKATLIENTDDIESGALAYALNGNEGGVERFYQKIGEDLFPMPIKKEGALVYAVSDRYRCDGKPIGSGVAYSNNPSGGGLIPPHEYEEGFCVNCSSLQEDYMTPVDGWFEISDGAELAWWSHYAALHLDASARLTDDIDMDGYSERWAQVGTEGLPFYGNFDGQFHTISNLIIDMPNANGVGLIGVMNSLPSANYGGISDSDARAAEGVYIKNVVLDETCSITGKGYVGLVGMTAPWAGHVNIQGVMMCGDVYANGGPNASGVFGCVMSSSCHVTINNCGMVGNVYGTKENGSFSGWLGSYAEVTNCFAVGSVEGIESNDRYFARYNSATFTNCYARYGTQVPTVSEEDFESGALAWRANGEQFRTGYWYQNIGEDLYPFPDPSHGTVIFAADQYFGVYGEEELGNVETAIQGYEEEAVAETIATQSLLEEYAAVIEAISEAGTILELADALDALNAKKAEVNENAAIYQAYIDKCEETLAFLNANNSFAGSLRESLEYYLTEADEPSEDNPLGTYEYIVDEHTATADEIKAETERVAQWLKNAIAEDYVPGTDISNLIPNGDFTEGRNEKWTNGFATGSGTLKSGDPELDKTVGVEGWAVTGDMFQTLEDMKPGYYLVGTHAAFRPSNNRYSTNYAAGIYANGTFNYFPTVIEDYIAVSDTIDQVNCNLHGDGAHDLPIYDDMFSTSGDEGIIGYAVHGERSIAAAANDGRYPVYTLGKVGEDGKLTIGIKNPGTQYSNDWTGWTAIKLTYLGEDPAEGAATVLENMKERAQTIVDYEYEEYPSNASEAAEAPNYPEELKEELQGILDGTGDDVTAIGKLSDVFQKIYEGKQAYINMYTFASSLEAIESGNLALVEKDEETGELIETDEMLFTEEEIADIEEAAWAIYDAYAEGSYSTETTLSEVAAIKSDFAGIIPAQDEDGYYLIGTPKELAAFRGISSFADYTVKGKLTADIDMSGIAMQPINQWDYSYRGTFDGQGYAISDVYISFESERCGLFNTLDGATVKNLKLTGDYYSGQKFMGGVAGYTYGATVQNCEVDVTLHSTVEGDGTHGGIVGNNDGSGTVVENCLVKTTLLGETTNSCGGVCGWASSTITVRNTLILSQGNTIDTSNGCNTISRNDGNCTVSNVFYVEAIGSANGTKVTAEQLASGEVTYKLNSSTSEGELAWFQTIGKDATPRLFDGATVYFYGGQYINEQPNPQLNAFAYDVEASADGENVTVKYSLNAEAEAVKVNFYDGETLVTSADAEADGLTEGAHSLTVAVGPDALKLSYEVAVTGKGTLEVRKVGDSYKIWGPYGMAINNNPASKGFGQVLMVESWVNEKYPEGYISSDKPGALFAFDAAFQPVNAADGTPGFYGGLDIPAEVEAGSALAVSGTYQFDLKDIRFTQDGRLFVARASGTSNSSVYELNPDNLNESWKPVFTGGELDEATGITYVGDEEQNRMAMSLAFEGKGDDLKMYVLGAQRSNGEENTTDFNCSIYNLGTATEWSAAPSASYEPLNGVYSVTPHYIGIHEDGQGGLWFIQYRTSPSETTPSIKHFNAAGEEDYSNTTTVTYGGKVAVTADGKYLAIPMGNSKIVVYETNYVPMANGSIYLNPVYNITPTETRTGALAFDYAGNLYVASPASETISRYTIPSWTDNLTVTPGRAITKSTPSGDLNGDGKVDIADAVTVLNIMAAGTNNAEADLNMDGKVDIADFVTVLNIMAAQ